jgi:signal recognition particle subunit SRP19
MIAFGIEHHLYTLISKHLIANPATEEAASRVRVPGLPPPDPKKEYPRPAVPKGWKMGSILPYYSPGLTGGGVSENFLKDMMAEMGGAGGVPGMIPGASGMREGSSGEVKKKDKKERNKG